MKLVVVGNCQADVIADLLRHMKPDWQIARARVLPSDRPRLQAGSGHLAGLSADGVKSEELDARAGERCARPFSTAERCSCDAQQRDWR